MKKGNSALISIQTTQRTNSLLKNLVKKLTPAVLALLLAFTLCSCRKDNPSDYQIMQEWQEKYHEELTTILNMELEQGELIKAYNLNNKTNLQMSYEYDEDNFIIVTSPLENQYQSLLDAAKNNASIQEKNVTHYIVSKDEAKAPNSLVNLIEVSFGKEDANKFKALCSPENGYCIVNEQNKTYEYILNDTYYKIDFDKEIPDEYFGDFNHMINYITNTKKLSNDEFKSYLQNQKIIALNPQWNLNIYTK